MLSPFMTVVVLVVLWLVVVIPMILRRSDEKRRDRSVGRFGASMRALGRRPVAAGAADDRAEVFVPRRTRAQLAAPARRPVPAAQEALMYPPDRSELSEARAQMLRRRRRSLATLIIGSAVFGLIGVMRGGAAWWLAGLFALGLVGYLWFLRGQAMRDRTRRENRQHRTVTRRPAGYDATQDVERFEQLPESMVRIDDDDLELQSMDTIDLTGLYDDSEQVESAQRRAS